MRKILLIAIGVILLSSPSFGDITYPLYEGKEYPVQAVTLDKLKDLDVRLLDLWNDIGKLNLSGAADYFSGEMYHYIDQIEMLLIIEELHSEYRQFNLPAIREISHPLILAQYFFEKDVPNGCDKSMVQSNAIPVEVMYLGKIKDISKEGADLIQEIKGELSEFK